MTILGLVGGLGPESTIDYYRRILAEWHSHDPATAPAIVIDSLDVQRGLGLAATDRAGLIEYLADSTRRLAAAGAATIAITANTPHLVFDEVAARSPVFARYGGTIVTPPQADRIWLHDRYVNQLLKGDFRDDTRAGVVALVDRLRHDTGADGVILGGTELPLLIGTPTIAGLPALDTTALHVTAIVERLRA